MMIIKISIESEWAERSIMLTVGSNKVHTISSSMMGTRTVRTCSKKGTCKARASSMVQWSYSMVQRSYRVVGDVMGSGMAITVAMISVVTTSIGTCMMSSLVTISIISIALVSI